MKKALILIFLSGFSFLLHAQSPKKKDSKITVTPSDTTDLITKITTALFDHGYQPDFKDDKAKVIVTKEKEFRTFNIKIRIRVVDSLITITGEARYWDFFRSKLDPKKDDYFEPVYFGGMKGSMARDAWDEIDKVAKSLGSVSYSK